MIFEFIFCAVFVEKILRIQPEIQKLYLLIRASNSDLAEQRLQNEVHHSYSDIKKFLKIKIKLKMTD